MATGKKAFMLYADQKGIFDKLPNEKAGELIKHILSYVNDEDPKTDDLIIQIGFESIKQQLKRDLQKYNNICDRNKKNGSKGGRPKNPNKPTGLSGNPKIPKEPDTDNDNDNDTDTDNDTDIIKTKKNVNKETFEFFWKMYPKKKAKPKAFDYWKKLKINEELLRLIIGSLQTQMSSEDWQKDGGKFIPYPQKWINEQRWLDEEVPDIRFDKPFNFNF